MNESILINYSRAKALLVVLFILFALVIAISGVVSGEDSELVSTDLLIESPQSGLANCRYGAATLGSPQVDILDDLGVGWYLNFNTSYTAAPNSAEFVSVITVKQNKTPDGTYLPSFTITPALTDAALGILIDSRPGALWIVGNEVDRGPDPGQTQVNQGDTFPDIYAEAYHDVYYFIKERDPSAQVANSALVQVTPGRLAYLDLMWEAYVDKYGSAMPVDVWNMHIYILPEVNPDGQPNGIANVALGTDPALGKSESYDPDGNGPLGDEHTCPLDSVYCYAEHDDMDVFAEQVTAMRQWMANHGERNKPLILSEFSILYPYELDPDGCYIQDEYGNCFTPQRVENFLNSSFNYLEDATDAVVGYPQDGNRLVQQWLWFSVNHGNSVGYVSNLVDGDYELTLIGQAYQNHVFSRITRINLYPSAVTYPKVFTAVPGGTATAIIGASVKNNGNIAPVLPVVVTFYKDQALTQIIGSATIQPPDPNNRGIRGCARSEIDVTVSWNSLLAGIHPYWVKVDSANSINESSENDNVASGFVMVNPQQAFLPAASR